MLSFHQVCEAIASGMILFSFIPGKLNPADTLSKHWGYSDVWVRLKMLVIPLIYMTRSHNQFRQWRWFKRV
jgi:hypothetical protein